MKRYSVTILIAMVIPIMGCLLGCVQNQASKNTFIANNASWTEKQVIDYLYQYLTGKAEQLQGQGEEIVIDAKFIKAVREATRESIDRDLGESVDMQFKIVSLSGKKLYRVTT